MEMKQDELCLALQLEPFNEQSVIHWNRFSRVLREQGIQLLLLTLDEGGAISFEFPVLTIPESYDAFSHFSKTTPKITPPSIPMEARWLIQAEKTRLASDATVAQLELGYLMADSFFRLLIQSLRPIFCLFWQTSLPISRHLFNLSGNYDIPSLNLCSGFMADSWQVIHQKDFVDRVHVVQRDHTLSLGIKAKWRDDFPFADPVNLAAFRKEVAADKKIISFFGNQLNQDIWIEQVSGSNENTTEHVLKRLVNALPKLSQSAVLVFVPAPDDAAVYLEQPVFDEVRLVRDVDEHWLVELSDSVIAHTSPVIASAIFQSIPVVEIKHSVRGLSPLSMYQATNESELVVTLDSALNRYDFTQRQARAEQQLIDMWLPALVSHTASVGDHLNSIDSLVQVIANNAIGWSPEMSLEQRWQALQSKFSTFLDDPDSMIHRLQGTLAGARDALPTAELNKAKSVHPKVQPIENAFQLELDKRYASWRQKNAQAVSRQAKGWEQRAARDWAHFPSFHFLTLCLQGDEARLAKTLDTLQQQFYQGFGLTVFADFTCPVDIFAGAANLEWRTINSTQAVIDEINQAIRESETDWLALIDCGDLAEPSLLFNVADEVNRHAEWLVVYVDDDIVDGQGKFTSCHFRSEFNLDLFYSSYYFGGLCFFRRDAFLTNGGFQAERGAENYDLCLRLLEQHGEPIFGHVDELLFHQQIAHQEFYQSESVEFRHRQVLQAHFTRQNISAQVQAGMLPGTHLVEYFHAAQPLVSVIIPTKDRLDLLKPCLETLLAKTAYPHFEVIVVDNQSSEQETLNYLDSVPLIHANVRVIRYDKPYNYSAMNNLAAALAQGEYLLLLNNDTVIIQENWLDRMMMHAQRPEVGVVGCRLLFPNQLVQHAGVLLGIGPADHLHMELQITDPGYMGRAQVVQNFSAVTAACMVIRKSIFDKVGGLDEKEFKILYNDIDLCLKVGEAGFKIVWTPFASLIHHGSSSINAGEKKKSQAEKKREEDKKKNKNNLLKEFLREEVKNMYDKWLPSIANDPYHNRNLSLVYKYPQPEIEMISDWQPNVRESPRVIGNAIYGATAEYRVKQPLLGLANNQMIQTCFTRSPTADKLMMPEISELVRLAPDTLLLQSFAHDDQLFLMQLYRRYVPELFMVYEIDDLKSEMPSKNPISQTMFKDFRKRLRAALNVCDRLVVTTEPLKEAYQDMIDDIQVIPNYLDGAIWGELQSLRRTASKPRVGWAGALQHQGDLEVIAEAVQQTAGEVDWVFFGMCPDDIRPYIKEFHEPVSFEQYPAKLASLNLDLAVAPLEYHRFNEAKSNLRILEYGALGWPIIATDIYPYTNSAAPGVKLVKNRTSAWVEAIRERIYDLDTTALMGDQLRLWVKDNWLLQQHLDQWQAALVPDKLAAQLPEMTIRQQRLA